MVARSWPLDFHHKNSKILSKMVFYVKKLTYVNVTNINLSFIGNMVYFKSISKSQCTHVK